MTSLSADLLAANRSADERRVAEAKAKLAELDPYGLGSDSERLAFWINLYNARVIEEFKERPRAGSLIRHGRVFNTASCRVGADEFTLNMIEHGLLRRNSRPPYSLRRVLPGDDRRLEAAPSKLDPRVHFALNCAAASCPPVRAYEGDQLDAQLDLATASYIQAETEIDRERSRVKLPYLLKLYRADFGGAADALRFVSERLPGEHGKWLREQAADGEIKTAWTNYDWTISA